MGRRHDELDDALWPIDELHDFPAAEPASPAPPHNSAILLVYGNVMESQAMLWFWCYWGI